MPLSVQQMIDCTNGLGLDIGTEMERVNVACQSGFPDVHLELALEQPLQSAQSYPYTGTVGNCRESGTNNITKSAAVLQDSEYQYFTDEAALLKLVQSGPVVTVFDIGDSFQWYTGGVYYDETCSNNEDEDVPPDCKGSDGLGYTCLGDCENKLPVHCDRYGVTE